MGTKKDHFPKTDSCNENARFFYLPNTNSVCLLFKNAISAKNLFVHNHPQNTIFLFFFEFCFPFFHIFSFSFSNIKKTKTKSAHFFSKTLFWHPDKLPKNYFRTPTHYLCFFKIPPKHYKIGENKKNLGPSFDATLDQVLTQKNQILDQVLNLQHIYIYIYAVGKGIWSPWRPFFGQKNASRCRTEHFKQGNPVQHEVYQIQGFWGPNSLTCWAEFPDVFFSFQYPSFNLRQHAPKPLFL